MAHVYLSIGKLMLEYNYYDEAMYNFNLAQKLYQEINQE